MFAYAVYKVSCANTSLHKGNSYYLIFERYVYITTKSKRRTLVDKLQNMNSIDVIIHLLTMSPSNATTTLKTRIVPLSHLL